MKTLNRSHHLVRKIPTQGGIGQHSAQTSPRPVFFAPTSLGRSELLSPRQKRTPSGPTSLFSAEELLPGQLEGSIVGDDVIEGPHQRVVGLSDNPALR